RDVYQREFHEPRNYTVTSTVVQRSGDGQTLRVHTRVDQELDRSGANDELLFIVNLLQENVGSVDVFESGATKEEYLRTIALDWEVFPPGTADEVTAALTKGGRLSEGDRGVIAERVALFAKQTP